MVMDAAKIERMEWELAEAKAQLLQEHGRRYEIVRREISQEEWDRIMQNLSDKQERILFGLEPPQEVRGRGAARPAASGGDLECPICGKTGLTKRGLALHTARIHKTERAGEKEQGLTAERETAAASVR
jgi:hypothetical protein